MNESSDSTFVTRNWNIINDQSKANYSVGHKIIYSTEALNPNLCDYNDAHILVRGDINIIARNATTQVTFKNCKPFTMCITKIDGTKIDDAENLDLVMSIC